MAIQRIEAVLFDMDGTLIDSEGLTEVSIERLLTERGLPLAKVDFASFHGITWAETATLLQQTFPELCGEPLATILPQKFHESFLADFPPLIDGSREAMITAAQHFATAIVTSSNRMSVEHLLDHLELREHCRLVICAEDCTRSKPDPQGYLLAAERLGVAPSRCLVFEDSVVGLRAAKSAGMTVVAISHGASESAVDTARELADMVVTSFVELPAEFFTTVRERNHP